MAAALNVTEPCSTGAAPRGIVLLCIIAVRTIDVCLVSATLTHTYSSVFSTGIGGDAFALFYSAGTREVTAMLGNGRSPAGLTMEVGMPP